MDDLLYSPYTCENETLPVFTGFRTTCISFSYSTLSHFTGILLPSTVMGFGLAQETFTFQNKSQISENLGNTGKVW